LKNPGSIFPEFKYLNLGNLNLGNSFSRNGGNITEDRFREGKKEQGNVKFGADSWEENAASL